MLYKKDRSGIARANTGSVITYGVLVAILEICYLIEVIKNSRTVGYFVVFSILALVPYFMCLFLYRADEENQKIKYIMAIGFEIFYFFIIFTTTSPIAYVYAIMIAVILLSYDNIRLILGYMIGVCAGNIIAIGMEFAKGELVAADVANTEIRIASLILFTGFMTVGTLIADRNNQSRMEEMEKEKERTSALNEQILHVSGQITDNIQIVADKMEVLESSSNKTKSSMEEVAQGTGETVESIQLQMEKTEQIRIRLNVWNIHLIRSVRIWTRHSGSWYSRSVILMI